jgi:predicted double-glycine peptidase
MRVLRSIAAAGLLLAPLAVTDLPVAQAGDIESGAAGSFNFPVTSMRERPLKTVVLQQYDFSCGAATVAMLLTYHYKMPTTEEDAFIAMYNAGDQEKIQQEGFSFLDMRNYMKSRDLNAAGFELTLDEIQELGVPTIALITLNGYRHFVLIKGIKDDRILIGNSAIGLMAMERDKFEAIRDPVVVLIRNKAKLGRKSFNLASEWSVKPKAPLSKATDSVRSTIFVDMTGNSF